MQAIYVLLIKNYCYVETCTIIGYLPSLQQVFHD